jgi:hypothetical protein
MSDTNHPTSVGYGRPPLHTRFKPGRSGNPSGRPKKRPTLGADLAEELAELVPADDGDTIPITRQRALLRKLLTMALSGNMKAANLVLALTVQEPEEDRSEEPAEVDREICEAFMEHQGGKVEPAALPAPQPSSEGGK